MAWFNDLKASLGAHYDPGFPSDTVGFLQGSPSPSVWRRMQEHGSGQMIVLGNRPPTHDDWVAAGVAQRGAVQEIKLHQLAGFIVIYGGFMYRPWGHIVAHSLQLERTAFPGSLQSWRRNFMAPRR